MMETWIRIVSEDTDRNNIRKVKFYKGLSDIT